MKTKPARNGLASARDPLDHALVLARLARLKQLWRLKLIQFQIWFKNKYTGVLESRLVKAASKMVTDLSAHGRQNARGNME